MIKKNSLIIIGKNSFIGSNLNFSLKNKSKVLCVSYKEFKKLKKKKINQYKYVCNCAVHKKYVGDLYKKKNDLDLYIANKIKNLKINYIFLSSRKIYKPRYNIKENGTIKPINQYSKNKIITENYLKKVLKKKLLILRISNVIGFKIKKNYKKVHNTFFDNYLSYLKKPNNIKYINEYKDFLTIPQLSKYFELIIKKNVTGIYNVSLGQKVYMKEILNWLNTYNTKKNKFINLQNNIAVSETSFTLNNRKISKILNFKPKKNELKNYCINISKIIH